MPAYLFAILSILNNVFLEVFILSFRKNTIVLTAMLAVHLESVHNDEREHLYNNTMYTHSKIINNCIKQKKELSYQPNVCVFRI